MRIEFIRPKNIYYPTVCQQVTKHLAVEIASASGASVSAVPEDPGSGFRISCVGDGWHVQPDVSGDGQWLWARYAEGEEGAGALSASEPAFLYALAARLRDNPPSTDALARGILTEPSFAWHRPVFDSVLTQTARHIRNFDPEDYIRRLAECGFTHFEVNGIAGPFAVEEGVPNEYYGQFYTYCAGLNYFVDSELIRGYYPIEYLEVNMNRVKKLVAIGKKYGLKPGLLCFEPRSLPEAFFQRYPTLRGARVDHPFRSYLPRYCLAQDHPVARKHYKELIQNFLTAVPEIEFMSVYTNDSGAGFEHTASLYVGRNGGPYMIREWRSHEKIAETAAKSATDLMRSWQEAGAAINPKFEIIMRIEPFKVEHDYILDGLGNGITIEAPSMLVRGYHLPYSHPKYEDQESAAGSIYHTTMDPSEAEKLENFRSHGFEPTLTYVASSAFNLEPLLGIPFPRMLHKRLATAKEAGFTRLNANGGLLNMAETPYWPNPEVIKAFQVDPDSSIDETLLRVAALWAGPENAETLVACWDAIEDAISYFPLVPLFSGFGYPWLRIWVRPFVPNLEAVPLEDRRPFERFMVSTPNNPSINDLGADVLFELINSTNGRSSMERFSENALPRIKAAIEACERAESGAEGRARLVFTDLKYRTRALSVWATCLRNVCAWVAGVHGYMETTDQSRKETLKADLQTMIDNDIENTRELLDLWETSPVEFMLVSDQVETSSVYGENLGELLRRKIELTKRYRNVEPFIDREILWRI